MRFHMRASLHDGHLTLVPAQVDPDKAFAVQMSLEESVLTDGVAYIQCALLYTSSNGERRIRRASCQTSLVFKACCDLSNLRSAG